MEMHHRQSELCSSVRSPAEAGETGVWATCNHQNSPTVRFSGRATQRAGEFTPRRQLPRIKIPTKSNKNRSYHEPT